MQHHDASNVTYSFEQAIGQEWIVTNGLGGYASSTAAGCNTRKYHGLLVAAMTPPVRRMVILSRVEETLIHRGWPHPLACSEYPGTVHPEGHLLLRAFNNDLYPRWGYQGDGWTLVKQLRLLKGHNTVLLRYILLGTADEVELELRPLFALRGMHELMYQWSGRSAAEAHGEGQMRIPPTRQTPEAFFAYDGEFTGEPYWYFNTIYRQEKERGYRGLEDLWMPGTLRWKLRPGQYVNFAVSTEPIDLAEVIRQVELDDVPAVQLAPMPVAVDSALDALKRAADAFALDLPNEAEVPAVVTQYHWGAPNVREALIGFAGLYLVTGRFDAARRLLLTLAGQVQRGLIPSEYTEDRGQPVCTAADTSLWFVQAVHDYLRYTRDEATVQRHLLPVIEQILAAYTEGTDLGISMRDDGLLQHDPGTTWMQARVAGVPVTPRGGCAVEVNALWHNALRIGAELLSSTGATGPAETLSEQAEWVRSSFNARFWNDAVGCCFDVIDDAGADGSIRPNQLLAVSLPYPVLEADRRERMLARVREHLMTPFGLRTLSPRCEGFIARKTGDVASRDRARHNGAVYPWLLGVYASALARVAGRSSHIRMQIESLLSPCIDLLRAGANCQLPELFDGSPPHAPGGAIASAVNVAELLRAYVEEVLDRQPAPTVEVLATPPEIEMERLPRKQKSPTL